VKLESEKQTLKKQLEEENRKIAMIENQLLELQKKLQTEAKEREQIDKARLNLEKELGQLKLKLAEAEKKKASAKDKEKLSKDLEQIKLKLENEERKKGELQASKMRLEEDLLSYTDKIREIEVMKHKLESEQEQIMNLSASKSNLEQDIRALRKEIQGESYSRKVLESELAELRKAILEDVGVQQDQQDQQDQQYQQDQQDYYEEDYNSNDYSGTISPQNEYIIEDDDANTEEQLETELARLKLKLQEQVKDREELEDLRDRVAQEKRNIEKNMPYMHSGLGNWKIKETNMNKIDVNPMSTEVPQWILNLRVKNLQKKEKLETKVQSKNTRSSSTSGAPNDKVPAASTSTTTNANVSTNLVQKIEPSILPFKEKN